MSESNGTRRTRIDLQCTSAGSTPTAAGSTRPTGSPTTPRPDATAGPARPRTRRQHGQLGVGRPGPRRPARHAVTRARPPRLRPHPRRRPTRDHVVAPARCSTALLRRARPGDRDGQLDGRRARRRASRRRHPELVAGLVLVNAAFPRPGATSTSSPAPRSSPRSTLPAVATPIVRARAQRLGPERLVDTTLGARARRSRAHRSRAPRRGSSPSPPSATPTPRPARRTPRAAASLFRYLTPPDARRPRRGPRPDARRCTAAATGSCPVAFARGARRTVAPTGATSSSPTAATRPSSSCRRASSTSSPGGPTASFEIQQRTLERDAPRDRRRSHRSRSRPPPGDTGRANGTGLRAIAVPDGAGRARPTGELGQLAVGDGLAVRHLGPHGQQDLPLELRQPRRGRSTGTSNSFRAPGEVLVELRAARPRGSTLVGCAPGGLVDVGAAAVETASTPASPAPRRRSRRTAWPAATPARSRRDAVQSAQIRPSACTSSRSAASSSVVTRSFSCANSSWARGPRRPTSRRCRRTRPGSRTAVPRASPYSPRLHDREARPVAGGRRGADAVDGVDRGVGGRRGRRQPARLDDRGAALLHRLDERARSQSWSVITSGAGLPPIFALAKSGYCVAEWLPQIVDVA